MEFTGERYIPTLQGQIKYEHLHRYALSLGFVEGKSVLDIASGEGYGAALLASKAQSVTGVDLDEGSVKHAQRRYYDPKLTFIVGSCESIPLPDASFDVVTSFETIEHHDKHEEMLREIKRVLKPEGVLIISSPNKLTYSDEPGYTNPFHVKELYYDEFHALLQRRFKYIETHGQRLATASFISSLRQSDQADFHAWMGDANSVSRKACSLPSPIYFVAVCSDLPGAVQREAASVYLDPANDLLKEFETERVTAIRRMEEQIERTTEELAQARNRVRRQSNEFAIATARYRANHHEHVKLIADLRTQLENHKAWLAERSSQVDAHAEALESILANKPDSVRWHGFERKLRRSPAKDSFEGVLDYPKSEHPAADEIEIYGWVYSTTSPVTVIQAFLDNVYLGIVSYGNERPDVAAAFPGKAPLRCGYKQRFWVNHLGVTGERLLRIIVSDANGNQQFYTRPITIEAAAPAPVAAETHLYALSNSPRAASTAAPPNEPRASAVLAQIKAVVADFQAQAKRDPTFLNWSSGLNLMTAFPNLAICSPTPDEGYVLPHFDQSVDFVVIPSGKPERMAEARRVSSSGVIQVSPDSMNMEWVALREKTAPPTVTSILIPVFNNSAYTQNCIQRLMETLPPDFKGEIIVVDDASTDETPSVLAQWQKIDTRIKVLRNPDNMGFIRSCNRGAAAASGEILVFLNNDTLPEPGWLPPLLRIFRDRPDAGAVGAKLLYPDGKLQEAGAVIFSDGSGCNFGKHDASADAPLYNFVREVDYCSGALLATRRDLFVEIGGFDALYQPAYYEDADYCFSLRVRGYKVYYQPESRIIHFEGVTSGTDISSGVKSYQAVNRMKFVQKWNEELQRQPSPPERLDFAALQSLSVRGVVN